MTDMKKVLIYGGKTGWIGGLMNDLVKKEGKKMRNYSFMRIYYKMQ